MVNQHFLPVPKKRLCKANRSWLFLRTGPARIPAAAPVVSYLSCSHFCACTAGAGAVCPHLRENPGRDGCPRPALGTGKHQIYSFPRSIYWVTFLIHLAFYLLVSWECSAAVAKERNYCSEKKWERCYKCKAREQSLIILIIS